MAAYHKLQGLTLLNVIDNIYKKYGYYSDALDSFTFKGKVGQDKIKSIVDKFRNIEELIKVFSDVYIVEDYKSQERYIIGPAKCDKIELPSSNVIKIYLSNQSWFAVRPTGTEPKLKIYFSSLGNSKNESLEIINSLRDKISKIIN